MHAPMPVCMHVHTLAYPHLHTHLWNSQPVFSQLHGMGSILKSILRIHGAGLRTEPWSDGIHKRSDQCSIVPVRCQICEGFVRELFLCE